MYIALWWCWGQKTPIAGRDRLRGTAEEKKEETHIDCDMAHQTGMMRQTNVAALIVYPLRSDRTLRSGVFIHDKGTLHVDLDGSGVGDGLLQEAGDGMMLSRHDVEGGVKKIWRGDEGKRQNPNSLRICDRVEDRRELNQKKEVEYGLLRP